MLLRHLSSRSRWIANLAAVGLLTATVACGDAATPGVDVATDMGSTAPSISSTTTTREAVASTTAPITTTTVSVSSTTPSPVDDTMRLLVAHDGGIALWSDEATEVILADLAVELAVADHRGGIVFQPAGEPPQPILWMPTTNDQPSVLVEEPDARVVWLQDVVTVNGRPTVIYRASRELPNDCPPDDLECPWDYQRDYLIAHDLATSEEVNLGIIGSFESSGLSYEIGETWTVVSLLPYGAEFTCVGLLETDDLLDSADPERWIGEGFEADSLSTPYGITGGTNWDTCWQHENVEWSVADAVTTDGTLFAFAESGPVPLGIPRESTTVAMFDPQTSTEIWRVEVPGPDFYWEIDALPDQVVLNRSYPWDEIQLPPVLVASDGTVTEIPVEGRVSFWASP